MEQVWESIAPQQWPAADILLVSPDSTLDDAPRRAIDATGHRLSRLLRPGDLHDWLALGERPDAIMIELGDAGQADWIGAADVYARDEGLPMLVHSPLDRVDELAGLTSSPSVIWMSEASHADRVATMLVAIEPRGPVLRDISSEMDPQRLRRLADEVSRIARALSSLTEADKPAAGYAASALSDVQIGYRHEPDLFVEPAPLPAAEEVRRIIRQRRLRDKFFDPSLFADPAWDMLLDLMAARLEQARVAVSSLCIAAAVPPTTALRWIKAMTDHGLFERCADPDDGRRIFIQLSDQAMQALACYFESAKKVGAPII